MKKRIAVIGFAVLALTGCTDPNGARHVLIENGYTDIVMTGYKPFACGREDNFSDGFTATTPIGVRVSGVVCGGWLKGKTIRFID